MDNPFMVGDTVYYLNFVRMVCEHGIVKEVINHTLVIRKEDGSLIYMYYKKCSFEPVDMPVICHRRPIVLPDFNVGDEVMVLCEIRIPFGGDSYIPEKFTIVRFDHWGNKCLIDSLGRAYSTIYHNNKIIKLRE